MYVLDSIKLFLEILNMGIGDWGLGIGPNPQSPIPKIQIQKSLYFK